MTKVAVVFHSGYGHTQRMAQAVAQGADAELITIDADGNLPEGAWAGSSRSLPMRRASPGTPRPGKTKSLVASPTAPT